MDSKSKSSSPADELRRLLSKAESETIQAPTDMGTSSSGDKKEIDKKEVSSRILSRLSPEWFGKVYGIIDKTLNRMTHTEYFEHDKEEKEVAGELTQIVLEEEEILLDPKWLLLFMLGIMYIPPTILVIEEKWFSVDEEEEEEQIEERSSLIIPESQDEGLDSKSFAKKLKKANKKKV